ncbi:MAG: ribonuclease E/G [Pseudomonadota bacterium]
MALRVIIDDAIVQTRAVLLDTAGPLRIALSGLSDGPATGAVVPAKVSKRIRGSDDCLVTLDDGHAAHLSGRRGGSDQTLTEGMTFIAQVVRAGDVDKRPEVRRVDDSIPQTPDWDEIDQFFATLPTGFHGDIRITSPQLWARRVPQWRARFGDTVRCFKQDFQDPYTAFEQSGAEQVLHALLARRWPLQGRHGFSGDIRFGSVNGVTVFDVNSGAPTGQKGALTTNKTAAQALARLISVGGFGGLMVVDFIDLHRHSDQKTVLEAFDAAQKGLGLSIKRTGWSKFGMVELQAPKGSQDLSAQLCADNAAGYYAGHVALRACARAAQRAPGPVRLHVAEPVYRWFQRYDAATLLSERLAMPFTLSAVEDWPASSWSLEDAIRS